MHPNPSWRDALRRDMRRAAAAEAEAKAKQALPERGPAFDYRWEHVQAVVRIGLRLAEQVGADADIVEAAAWLHDVRKLDGAEHGRAGADYARVRLPDTDFPVKKIPAVSQAIAEHVGLWRDVPLEALESQVLWDADKLSKLGLTGALHVSLGSVALGRPPRGSAAAGSEDSSSDALLQSLYGALPWMEKTLASMHTVPARQAAEARLLRFRAYLRDLSRELDATDV